MSQDYVVVEELWMCCQDFVINVVGKEAFPDEINTYDRILRNTLRNFSQKLFF